MILRSDLAEMMVENFQYSIRNMRKTLEQETHEGGDYDRIIIAWNEHLETLHEYLDLLYGILKSVERGATLDEATDLLMRTDTSIGHC